MSTLAESIKADADRSLARHQTYEAVERIYAIPGVVRVNVIGEMAYAFTEYGVFNRKSFLESGDSSEDAILKLEQAVRDAYMAVS